MPPTVDISELESKGYTVVKDVMSPDDCDRYINIYRQWLAQFNDSWPISSNSLIQRYQIGHMEPSWGSRLKAKKVFEQIWGTDQLLTSFDAVAIGRPPEDGEETFAVPGKHWLHCDQGVERVGLHAYQGAVYLEAADEDDWTFEVLEGSHVLHSDFFEASPRAKMRSITNKFYGLTDADVEWYTAHNGVTRRRVPAPKGGMIIWDSRLIHANVRPKENRRKTGRWRYVVFVSMGPTVWAGKQYLRQKKQAYQGMRMTSHWPCNGLAMFSYMEVGGPMAIDKLPIIACTDDAKRLAGVLSYPGPKKGPSWRPQWAEGSKEGHEQTRWLTPLWVVLGVAAISLVTALSVKRTLMR
ncbi:uncharacterized protein LOC124287169 [Haliotis rubra]|uniref:uncharacterized protein LOC124287169 n=1 Tax=Haliotis rubra TaxID=36100 RepID=UPI001EE5371E|nr:uncharacterized protein LOC124287169 [Haliotis rubra]